MLGAVLKATGLMPISALQEPLKERFGRIADKNLASMKRAYDETVVKE
jgi:pyruvate ferredoxin oxidoreductase gamma subunit